MTLTRAKEIVAVLASLGFAPLPIFAKEKTGFNPQWLTEEQILQDDMAAKELDYYVSSPALGPEPQFSLDLIAANLRSKRNPVHVRFASLFADLNPGRSTVEAHAKLLDLPGVIDAAKAHIEKQISKL